MKHDWGGLGGCELEAGTGSGSTRTISGQNLNGRDDKVTGRRGGEMLMEEGMKKGMKKEGEVKGTHDTSGKSGEPSKPGAFMKHQGTSDIFENLKQEHDLAKAIKANDAEVPVELWDTAVCRRKPTPRQVTALPTIRVLMLRLHRRWLWQDMS